MYIQKIVSSVFECTWVALIISSFIWEITWNCGIASYLVVRNNALPIVSLDNGCSRCVQYLVCYIFKSSIYWKASGSLVAVCILLLRLWNLLNWLFRYDFWFLNYFLISSMGLLVNWLSSAFKLHHIHRCCCHILWQTHQLVCALTDSWDSIMASCSYRSWTSRCFSWCNSSWFCSKIWWICIFIFLFNCILIYFRATCCVATSSIPNPFKHLLFLGDAISYIIDHSIYYA